MNFIKNIIYIIYVSILLLTNISLNCFAQTETKTIVKNNKQIKKTTGRQKYFREARLSRSYVSGPNLIYDCENMYFACVSYLSYEKCPSLKMLNSDKKKCYQMKGLKTYYKCIDVQKKIINQFSSLNICTTNKFNK